MKWYLARVWALGEWPFWYPNLLQGMPFMSQMHPGVFYPPSVLFLIKDFLFAFHAYFLFHHLILMFSVYALCRYWGNSIQASICASLTSLLGGYFLSLASVYNHFHSAVWFPLILMMWQKYSDKGSLKYFCGAVIFLSFQVLGGGPEHAIFSVSLVYAHSLYLDEENDFKRKTLGVFFLVFAAMALSAIQWIPTYYFKQELYSGSGLDLEASTRWSLSFETLLELFLPPNLTRFLETDVGIMETEFWRMEYFLQSFYMGIVPIFILFYSLLVNRKNKQIRFWGIVFGWGVFFVLGKFNPLYSLFHEWVPIFNLFRYPQKFFFICAFALVFLLGFSLDRLVDRFKNNKNEIRKILLALFVTSAGVAAILGAHSNRSGLETLMVLLLLTLTICALHLKRISQTKFFCFLLLLMIVDLMGKNSMLIPMIDKKYFSESPPLAKRLGGTANSYRIYSGKLLDGNSKTISDSSQIEAQKDSTRRKKLFDNLLNLHLRNRDQIVKNFGTIQDLAYPDGLVTRNMKTAHRWKHWFGKSDIPRKKIILQRSNVKYWVTKDYDQVPTMQNLSGVKKVTVFENALPRAFLVDESQYVSEKKLLEIYFDSNFDPLKRVLLRESVPLKKTENFSGQVEELQYSPNKVILKTRQNGDGFLVLLDTFYPGWKVTVDGIRQPIYRANAIYRAVKLGAGDHSLEFSYFPVGLKTGIYISACALILILFLFFKPKRTNP